jgi:hypothetical protein
LSRSVCTLSSSSSPVLALALALALAHALAHALALALALAVPLPPVFCFFLSLLYLLSLFLCESVLCSCSSLSSSPIFLLFSCFSPISLLLATCYLLIPLFSLSNSYCPLVLPLVLPFFVSCFIIFSSFSFSFSFSSSFFSFSFSFSFFSFSFSFSFFSLLFLCSPNPYPFPSSLPHPQMISLVCLQKASVRL